MFSSEYFDTKMSFAKMNREKINFICDPCLSQHYTDLPAFSNEPADKNKQENKTRNKTQ